MKLTLLFMAFLLSSCGFKYIDITKKSSPDWQKVDDTGTVKLQ